MMNRRSITIGLTILALLICGLVAWQTLIKDKVIPKRFGVVEPGAIYRSGQIDPRLIQSTLEKYKITRVIDLRYWEEKPGILAEQQAIKNLHIKGYRFPLNGNGTGDVENYLLAVEALDAAYKAGEPVLVHCAAGSQRTGGVLAVYRTLVLGIPAAQTVQEMEQYDWDPETDQILLDYLNQHIGYFAQQLQAKGVIAEVPSPLPHFQNPM